MCSQSVSADVVARAWQAAIAAWSAYGPSAPPSASARSSAARPRRMRSWSHRPRSCSRSRTGSPDGPTRARRREAWSLHQRNEPVDLRLPRSELCQDAAEPQRVFAQLGSQPVVAGGRRVALVEDEIDDLEHRREAIDKLGPARHLERNVSCRERPLGADDPLRHRRLGHEERPSDLVGRQTAEHAQRERGTRFPREHGMAGREDQAQQIVANVVVQCRVDLVEGRLLSLLELAAELRDLALECLAPPMEVDRAMLRGGHEPGTRIVGDAGLRPPLERYDEGILRELLCDADVACESREAGDQPRRLDPPDRLDRAVRGGDRHGRRTGCATATASRSRPSARPSAPRPPGPRRATRRRSRPRRTPGGSRSRRRPASGHA